MQSSINACLRPRRSPLLGEDVAEEGHIGPELLGQGVQTREGSEVDRSGKKTRELQGVWSALENRRGGEVAQGLPSG